MKKTNKVSAKSAPKSSKPSRQVRDMALVAKGTKKVAGPDGLRGDTLPWPTGERAYFRSNPRREDGKWVVSALYNDKRLDKGQAWAVTLEWNDKGRHWMLPAFTKEVRNKKGVVTAPASYVLSQVHDSGIGAALGMKVDKEWEKKWVAKEKKYHSGEVRKPAKGKKKVAKKGDKKPAKKVVAKK